MATSIEDRIKRIIVEQLDIQKEHLAPKNMSIKSLRKFEFA